ncbi:sugar ABC transporter substrate-binding protein [Pseudomonas syringae pv. cerasicola]|nr:sugar ABC transporter substrate-binding protein [Pseudomonas syringae pv. cerasicola]SPF16831.1 sugar ABC transporter substrate-binding protein [Pseudomonas syringae pv. cerasicola]
MLRFSKRFTLTLGAVLALALSPIIQAQTGKRLALVQVNQQALYFTQITQGAQAAAKAAGAELVVFNANDNPSAQNDAIEAYIQDKVDAILVCAIDVNGIKPAVTAAAQAGIPVVAIDAVINGDNAVQVGVDNREAARQIGQYTGEYINRELAGKASIGVVGALGSYCTESASGRFPRRPGKDRQPGEDRQHRRRQQRTGHRPGCRGEPADRQP